MMEWGWWVLLALPVVGMVTLAGCGLLDMAEQGVRWWRSRRRVRSSDSAR